MLDDAELLRRYADEKSEDAFAELVRRHLNLVYSVALRQVAGDAHLAEDVAQLVFVALARKARSLAGRPALSGWLYRSAHFAASDVVRTERRRRAREQEVYAMNPLFTDSATPADWEKIRPLLDAAIVEFDERDRDAVALRFFEGRSFAEVGVKLRLNENSARMRVERALEKLRAGLARRGVTSTSVALGVVLANQAGAAVPAGLAVSVTSAALSGASTAVAVTFMSMTKLQLGVAGVLALAGTTGFLMQAETRMELQNEIAQLQQENRGVAALQKENLRFAGAEAEVEALRRDEAALEGVRDEAAALRNRLRSSAAASVKRAEETEPGYTGEVYEALALDQQPKPISQAAPLLPAEMLKARIPGKVLVEFVVDAKGAVHDVHVLSSTRSDYEVSVIEAVKLWQYAPGEKNGGTVNTRMTVPIVFTFDRDADRPEASQPPAKDGKRRPATAPWF